MNTFFGGLVLAIALARVRAAVHVYKHEALLELSDALVFKGGHEGMFHTREPDDSPTASTQAGSILRLLYSFLRPKRAAVVPHMQAHGQANEPAGYRTAGVRTSRNGVQNSAPMASWIWHMQARATVSPSSR